MFGSVQAGKTVAENKNLFDNKLTLLSAQTGQLLSTTSALLRKTPDLVLSLSIINGYLVQ